MRERNDIGGYRIIKKIGFGGMSSVFEAVDHGGNRVALKLLHPSISADPAARDRLRREVRTLQQVTGPYVAHVIDAETEDDDAFIVTELIDGPTLSADVTDNGVYVGKDLADLAKELADALVAIHSKGVLHRDLKPSNVMMSDRGPVLIDFGIAQVAEESRLTATGLIAHTPGYCAPEILNGEDPSEQADWWAWAATLAYAATGKAPFGSGHSPKVTRKVLTGEADLEDIDPVVAYALEAALLPQGERRPSPAHVIGMLDGSVEVSDEDLAAGPDPTKRERNAPAPSFNPTMAQPVTPSTEFYRQPPAYPVAGSAPEVPQPREQFSPTYQQPQYVPQVERRGYGEVPDWLIPPRKRPGICFMIWVAFVAWAGVFPMVALIVFALSHLLASIAGAAWESLNRSRIAHGGRYRGESMSIMGKLPGALFLGAFHTLTGVGTGVVLGGGLAWLLTAVTSWPASLPLALGGGLGAFVAWIYPTSEPARKVARKSLGVIAPTTGYSLFWVVLALALMSLAIAMYSSPDIPDWSPFSPPGIFVP